MNLEFYIKLRELVSGGLAKMAETAKKTTAAIKGTNDTLGQSFDTIKNKVQQLESVISRSTSVSKIREARSELEKLQRVQSRHPANISAGGGGLFAGALRSVLPAFGVAGALMLGGSVLNSGLEAQSRQASFEVLAGKEGGTRLNQNLTKYAQESIYGNEVYKNAQTMLGFGINEKEIMPTLKMLGDVAMGDVNKLGSLSLAFSQVKGAGRLMGQEVLQFINAGFNPLQQISKDTGLSLVQLKKKMEDGQISFSMVEQAFKNATGAGGMFYKMTEKIGETDFGKWQAFKGQLDGIAMQLGGILAPAFGFLITNALVPFANALQATVTWIKENASWLAPLAIAVTAAATAYGLVVLATQAWTAAQWLLNAAMTANPIGLIIAGIAALVALVVYAWNKFGWFRGAIYATWEAIKGFGIAIKDYVVDRVKGLITGLGALGSMFLKLFTGDFSGAWESAKTAASNLIGVDATVNAVKNMKAIGKASAKAYRDGVNEVEGSGSSSVSAAEANAATPGGGALSNAIPAKSGAADEAVKGVTSGGPRVINITIAKMVEKIDIHTAKLDESLTEVESKMEEMFLRILNSGAATQ